MRKPSPQRSPRPPADKVLVALTCMSDRELTVTATEAEIAAQARIPEPQVLPALQDLARRGEIQLHRARKGTTSWLVNLEHDPDAPGDTLTIPWADPIEPPRKVQFPPMPADLPLPFYERRRKTARSLLKLVGGLQSLEADGLCRATLAEISAASGLRDLGTVRFHLDRLESEGVIRTVHGREFGRPGRAFELLKRVEVPPAIWPGLPSPPTEPPATPGPAERPTTREDHSAARRLVPGPRSDRTSNQLTFGWADGTT